MTTEGHAFQLANVTELFCGLASQLFRILAEGAIALPVTLSGGALFAS